MPEIKRLLIANRGEIACRVIRSARELGIHTVAVYSTADRAAPHRALADESVCIGAGPVNDSYLNSARILEVVTQTRCDAVHPGYGFLSENAEFARTCANADVIFVGPSPEAIEAMGNKAAAKRLMLTADVPCIEGYESDDQSNDTLYTAGVNIGFPLMVKAAAGGGGRGMRLVHHADELITAIDLARSESLSAFGSGELILERAIVNPRHVEVQIMADQQGHVIHLGERDCSVQRRHQKVLEESPCPVMTPELRERMGAAAVAAAQRIHYQGAGTVEFLLDSAGEFYFLEMNTRLQVKHPVTELVTGLDLVALQLKVASGVPLTIQQHDVTLTGHAIEARLYAEDPAHDFAPSIGPIVRWQPPADVRVDDGVTTGQVISPFYDSMLAKVIAFGPTREVALKRLQLALKKTVLFGPVANTEFLLACCSHRLFAEGKATTAFIQEAFGEQGFSSELPSKALVAQAAALRFWHGQALAQSRAVGVNPALLGWSNNRSLVSTYRLRAVRFEEEYTATVSVHEQHLEVSIDAQIFRVRSVTRDQHSAQLRVGNDFHHVQFAHDVNGSVFVASDGVTCQFIDVFAAHGSDIAVSEGTVNSPMHGVVVEVLVGEGDEVAVGTKLALLEAMKMQHEIVAPCAGKVVQVAARAGQQIAADELLVEIDVDDKNNE